MSEIIRKDISEEWAHSGIIKAGDYCFLCYCVGNIGGTYPGECAGPYDLQRAGCAPMGTGDVLG